MTQHMTNASIGPAVDSDGTRSVPSILDALQDGDTLVSVDPFEFNMFVGRDVNGDGPDELVLLFGQAATENILVYRQLVYTAPSSMSDPLATVLAEIEARDGQTYVGADGQVYVVNLIQTPRGPGVAIAEGDPAVVNNMMELLGGALGFSVFISLQRFVQMPPGVLAEDVTYAQSGPAMTFTIKLADGSMITETVPGVNLSSTVVFDDGFSIPVSTLQETSDGVVRGTEGDDVIDMSYVDSDGDQIGPGDDHVLGLGGDDVIATGAGNDILVGGDGNDVLHGGEGLDVINGGGGFDIFSAFGGTEGIVVALNLENGAVGQDGFGNAERLVSIEGAYGTSFEDVLFGNNEDNVFYGFGGNDVLFGSSGFNVLSGGDGDDLIQGGSGDDVILGGAGVDTIRGGSGFDIWSAFDATEGAAVILDQDRVINDGFGNLEVEAISGIEALHGSSFEDYFVAGSTGSTLYGIGGADSLFGLVGADAFFGGDDDDFLIGGSGDDFLDGGAGFDRVWGSAGFDTWSAATGTQGAVVDLLLVGRQVTNDGFGTHDSIMEIENLYGSAFADTFLGDDAANALTGLGGADVMFGRGGNDFITGGLGSDYIEGGDGYDYFAFAAADFAAGQWDGIGAFSAGGDSADFFYFTGLVRSDLTIFDFNGDTYILSNAVGNTGGIFIGGVTAAEVEAQLLFA